MTASNKPIKIIEDVVEKFKESYRGILSDDIIERYAKDYTKTLTHIHTQAKEEVLNEMEELIKSKATLKTYFGDEYCSVDGFLEALEKHGNS